MDLVTVFGLTPLFLVCRAEWLTIAPDVSLGHIDLNEFEDFLRHEMRIKLPRKRVTSHRILPKTLQQTPEVLKQNPISRVSVYAIPRIVIYGYNCTGDSHLLCFVCCLF